jgi:hypothetical protein
MFLLLNGEYMVRDLKEIKPKLFKKLNPAAKDKPGHYLAVGSRAARHYI